MQIAVQSPGSTAQEVTVNKLIKERSGVSAEFQIHHQYFFLRFCTHTSVTFLSITKLTNTFRPLTIAFYQLQCKKVASYQLLYV